MPLVSVCLGNQSIQAAVGREKPGPGRPRVQVKNLCQAPLPPHCLEDGVITDEAALAAALRGFWAANALPRGRVALAVHSSRFVSHPVTAPALPPRQLAEIARQELAARAARGQGTPAPYLADYLCLPGRANSKTVTLLATAVETELIARYAALARAAGLTLCSVDTALASGLQLTTRLAGLAGKSYLLLFFEGQGAPAPITALLVSGGCFCGTARLPYAAPDAWQAALAPLWGAAPSAQPVTDAYTCGASNADFAACLPGCAALGLRAAKLPDAPRQAMLPAGFHLADWLCPVGNLLGR
ncbi:MAG: hypothetical protein PHO10_00160 [Gemmiger sp.]|nr:hypothetical protein [Gemmiger sp.]